MNWGVYGFPKRAKIKPIHYNRVFNGMPYKEESIMYYDAEISFADAGMSILSQPGGLIASVMDLSPAGNHMFAGNNPKPTRITDNGFAAIRTNGNFLTSSLSASPVTQIAVYRSPSATFNEYGAVLGRSTRKRPYLFRRGGDYYHSAPDWSRRNGVSGLTIAPINVMNLLVMRVASVSTDSLWHLGRQDAYSVDLIIYEAAQFPYELLSHQIDSIESYFMGKYGLV